MSSFDSFKARWVQIAGSAWYAALLTFLSFVAALFGSLYEADIKSAFPFVVGCCNVNKTAFLFWVLAIVAAAMFWSAQSAANARRERAELRLIGKTEDLERQIQTLPPADFLSYYAEFDLQCHRAFTDAIADSEVVSDRDELYEVIRFLLFSTANLVRNFEGSPAGVVYAANIMVFRPASSLEDTELRDIQTRLRFVPEETDVKALRGVLELLPGLSTSTLTNDAAIDANITALVLPVPINCRTQDGKRWRALPGAPLAFCEANVSGYTDTKQLSEWCRNEGDFPPTVSDAVEKYFGSEASGYIRSFVSAPLAPGGTTPIAILNIHSSRPDLLSGKEPAKHFWPLLESIRAMLLDLLLLVNKVELSTPKSRNSASPIIGESNGSRDVLAENSNGTDQQDRNLNKDGPRSEAKGDESRG